MRYIIPFVAVLLLFVACSTTNDAQTNEQTITGTFYTDKACMGTVNGVLLLDFVNDCERAAEYDGKYVEVVGEIHTIYGCPPDEQCAIGDRMSNMKSIRIITAPVHNS